MPCAVLRLAALKCKQLCAMQALVSAMLYCAALSAVLPCAVLCLAALKCKQLCAKQALLCYAVLCCTVQH